MRLIPLKKDISAWTAGYIVNKINILKPAPTRPLVLGLPTGGTPLGTYKELIRYYNEGVVDFENVTTFNMDEYVGLPENDPQSYHYYMQQYFFKYVNIKPENIHILDGNAQNLKQECDNYENKIREAGGIKLFLGGVGSDGHIAFNEPFSSLTSRTRVKTLTRETRQSNSRFFDNDINNVPKMALTVGIQTLLDSNEILILASGYEKSLAILNAVEGCVNNQWTISALQLHKKCIIVCDENATAELKIKTVKYFKEIEKENI